jgi:Flp pilus assembly protein TadG
MKSLLNLLLRLARCSRGTAAIEGVIVLPVAISLMAGGVEFGRIYNTASTADKSMRSAARYLARIPCTTSAAGICSASTAICGWGLTNAQNLAVYGNIAGQGNALITGWTTAKVTLQQPSNCNALPNPVIIQLKADVPFTAIVLSAVGLSNSMTLHVQHEERWIGE